MKSLSDLISELQEINAEYPDAVVFVEDGDTCWVLKYDGLTVIKNSHNEHAVVFNLGDYTDHGPSINLEGDRKSLGIEIVHEDTVVEGDDEWCELSPFWRE